MEFYYCPTCARVYFLPEEAAYLCAKPHILAVWKDGRKRRYMVSERAETDKTPWVIPELVEEKEVMHEDSVDSWLDECKNPTDTEFGDYRRHFGHQTLGGKHLTRDQLIYKFEQYVLRLARPRKG